MSTETQPLQTDHINFKDFDKGYAPFAEALRSLGFNWQIALTEDLKGFCRVHGGDAQLFFRLPAATQGPAAAMRWRVEEIDWNGIDHARIAEIRVSLPALAHRIL